MPNRQFGMWLRYAFLEASQREKIRRQLHRIGLSERDDSKVSRHQERKGSNGRYRRRRYIYFNGF